MDIIIEPENMESNRQVGTWSLKRWLVEHFKAVLALKTSPHSLAFGFSIATLISTLPTFGFGTLIGMGIVLVYKQISKVALFAGLAFWNPLFIIPVYSGAFWLGDWIFGEAPILVYEVGLLEQALGYTRRFLVGNIAIALVLSILGYCLVYAAAWFWQNRAAVNAESESVSSEAP